MILSLLRIVASYNLTYHHYHHHLLLFPSLLLLIILSLISAISITSITVGAAAASSSSSSSSSNNLAFIIASSRSSSSSSSSSRIMMNDKNNNINENKPTTTTTTTTTSTTTTTPPTDTDKNFIKEAASDEEEDEEEEEDNNMNATTTTTTTTTIHRFGKFIIPKTNIFCISPNKLGTGGGGATAFVNLRPIVPGHVLVMPKRIVPYMHDLTEDEYVDMWLLVRRVQNVLKNAYPKTSAFNIAVQDGKDAGQSIPHVHVHILPRHSKDDFEERNDDVYDKLEQWAPTLLDEKNKIKSNIDVPNDNERIDRTEEMMTNEANMYRKLLLELELSESVSK